jgi:hypothetical protein
VTVLVDDIEKLNFNEVANNENENKEYQLSLVYISTPYTSKQRLYEFNLCVLSLSLSISIHVTLTHMFIPEPLATSSPSGSSC